jgi:hypothetical protein
LGSLLPIFGVILLCIFSFSEHPPSPTISALKTDEDSNPTLWMATGQKEPIHFEEIQNPSQFVLTGSGFACFSAFGDGAPPRSGNV